jgi:hypothetical protein
MNRRCVLILASVLVVSGCGRSALFGGSILHGRVIVDGGSASGLIVTALGPASDQATTDKDGQYSFAHASTGRYAISVTVHDTLESSRTVEAMIGPGLALPDLRFTAVGALRGRALRGGDTSGDAGILVTVDGTSATAVTDDGGNYQIDRVPVGTVDLTAQADGFSPGHATGQIIHWGQITDAPDIDLVIAKGPTHLRGIALMYGASDHSGTRVVVKSTGLSTTTDSKGNWSIDDLPEGTYALHFTNGPFDETVPAVQTTVGGEGLIVDGGVYPLPSAPLTIYRGKRITQGHIGVPNRSQSVEISPDGAHVAFVEDSNGTAVKLAAVDGSGTRSLATNVMLGNFDYYPAQFSPDSAYVSFIDHAYLELAPVAGGPLTRLASGANYTLWSPTSAGLSLHSFDPAGHGTLNYVSIGGSAEHLVTSDGSMTGAVWASDGVNLFYRNGNIETDIGNFNVVARDGSPTLTIGGVPMSTGSWNLARTWQVLQANMSSTQGVGDIESVELSTHKVHTLATGLPFSEMVIAGDRAVIMTWSQSDFGTIWSAPLDGSSAAIKLATGASQFWISKDGSRIAYFTDCTLIANRDVCKLWTVTPAGGTPWLASSQALDSSWGLSDDGTRIMFMGPTDAGGHGPLYAGTVGQPIPTIGSGFGFAGFLADNSVVLFYPDLRSVYDATLSIAFLADGRTATIADSVNLQAMNYAPDGNHVAFVSQPLRLHMASSTGDPALALMDVPNNEAFVWSSLNALVVTHVNTPAPYRFQDGLYVFTPQ